MPKVAKKFNDYYVLYEQRKETIYMEEIKRDKYLNKLITKKGNGLVKIVTGIRRSGKSYLLDPMFKNYLLSEGVKSNHIIKLDLDERQNKQYLNPDELDKYIRERIVDNDMYYIILDEIQKVDDFESVLNGFLHIENLDIYVTGSNSKFLSSDIKTEFRGRGDEIRVLPLSFSEFQAAFKGSADEAWNEYKTFGGLPKILDQKTPEEKSEYLKNLFDRTYLSDIIERHQIQRKDVLDSIVSMIASSVGSLTNPKKISDTFTSNAIKDVSINTITSYLDYLEDAFLIKKAERYDVRGKTYISTPFKYYFADIGLRNAKLNFRQLEEDHIMENIIYNELIYRGYNVDVGVVELREGAKRKQTEIDFVCNHIDKRYYIQCALALPTREKTLQEEKSLMNTNDNFRKIIVVKDNYRTWTTEEGITVVGLKEFLLNPNSLDL